MLDEEAALNSVVNQDDHLLALTGDASAVGFVVAVAVAAAVGTAVVAVAAVVTAVVAAAVFEQVV